MKYTIDSVYRLFVLLVLLTVAGLGMANAQDRNINVNERLDLRALGINNEVQQITSLTDLQVKFFNRGDELKKKSTLSLRDADGFRDEGNKRKADLAGLQRQFDALINKLKQGNNWNETFDAQFLAAIKIESARSALTQAGGARKVLQAAAAEISRLRDDIDEEVSEVSSKEVGSRRSRNDRVLAAHASPLMGNVRCSLLLAAYNLSLLQPGSVGNSTSCAIAKRFNDKGCLPKIDCH